jgi:hypothetical protein
MAQQQEEEKKRKKYLLPVILLFAVCLIGTGFAYTAWTENGGNQPPSEYITLTQTGDGKYHFTPDDTVVYYDSKTLGDSLHYYATIEKYRLTEYVSGSVIDGAVVTHLGKSFNIHTERVHGTYSDLTCQVSTDFAPTIGWNIYLVLKTVNTSGEEVIVTMQVDQYGKCGKISPVNLSSDNTFTIYKNQTLNQYNDVTVDVYYGYIAGSEDEWIDTVPPKYPLSGETAAPKTITFMVDSTPINPPGVELNYAVVKIGTSGSVVLEATLTPELTGTVVWTTDDTSNTYTTHTVDGNNCTVNGAAIGKATYTATLEVSSGQYAGTYTVSCKVIVGP